MYAVLKTGGKQYRVEKGDVVKIEKIDAKQGDRLVFKDIYMISADKGIHTDSDTLAKASVEAVVLEQTREKKIKVFKKKRRKDYQRTLGHKQQVTQIQITNIIQ